MTVKELIRQLENCNPESEVRIWVEGEESWATCVNTAEEEDGFITICDD